MYRTHNSDTQAAVSRIKRTLFFVAAAFVLLMGACMSSEYIEPGTAGVVISKTSDGVLERPLGAGWHFVNPLTQRVVEMDYTNQTYAFGDAQSEQRIGPALRVNSIEGQRLDFNGTISIELDPQATPELYQKFRRDVDAIVSSFVYPALVSTTQSVVGTDSVGNVLGKNKEAVRASVQRRLSDTLSTFGFRIAQFVVGDIVADDKIVAAINAKNEMQQQVLTVMTETQKRIQKARGDSVEAALRATAILLDAQAKAKAAELLSQVGNNAAYLQAQALENQKLAIQKWNGTVPQWSTGGEGGPIPFINITTPKRQ